MSNTSVPARTRFTKPRRPSIRRAAQKTGADLRGLVKTLRATTPRETTERLRESYLTEPSLLAESDYLYLA